MANMANIVVKKADGVTDVTFTALQPSSGDGVSAVWRCESVGSAAGLRPTLTLSSRWNGPRTARRLDAQVQYPQIYTDTATGLSAVRNRVVITVSAVIPVEMPDSDVAEAVMQAFNLFDSQLFTDSVKAGYAPT